MRRFTLVSVVVTSFALPVVAWVYGQDQAKPKASQLKAPARLDSEFIQAMPLSKEPATLELLPQGEATGEIIPVAAPGETEENGGVIHTARRLFGTRSNQPTHNTQPAPRTLPSSSDHKGSKAPPNASRRAASPSNDAIPEIPTIESGEPVPVQEGVSSVLKKKPVMTTQKSGSSLSTMEIKPTPQASPESSLGSPQPTAATPSTPAVSSRRIGGAKVPSIRSVNESEGNATPTAAGTPNPRSTSASEKLQLRGTAPHLTLEATGPQAVTVGKPATYVVLATNSTDILAENVAVRIGLPNWVSVEGGEGTRGDARQETDAAGRQWLVWTMQDIAPHGKEQLMVNLTVQQPQPFEFLMNWTQKNAEVATEIAVREPRLDIRLEGPSDMLHGEEKSYTLHIGNPGTGDTDNVVVEVMVGNTPANRIPIGMLAAGESKEIPFPITAAARGALDIRAVAHAEAGLKADAAARVQIRKAELQVAVAAPELKFAGGDVSYEVAVANTGDAMADQITLSIGLPSGAKYVGGIDGAATAGDALSLKMGSLPPGTEKVFDVRCVLTQAGDNRFQASVQGKGDLAASDAAVTKVEALADLKLVVNEPTGPMVVGSDAVYEVHLLNRGTKSAGKVQVVVQFAQGLEPYEVAGAKADVADGQAVFEMLPDIAPGKELVMKVKSKVEQTGNHAFRVEVKALDPETKLVSEGVTRCFDNGSTVRAARKTLAPANDGGLQR
jgi:CARDB/Domain of unknown function DUF11